MKYQNDLVTLVKKRAQGMKLEGINEGAGPTKPKLIIIGEAPGREEIVSHIPFHGDSGKELMKSLASIGLKREDVYITSAVRSRPYSVKKVFSKKENTVSIYTNNNKSGLYNATAYSNNISSDMIYSNKIYSKTQTKNRHDITISNEVIYSDNILYRNSARNPQNCKIFVKAIDVDEKLFYFSQFFRQGKEKDKKHNKLDFEYEKINKLLNCEFRQKYKLKPEVNLIIFKNITEKMPEIFDDIEFWQIIESKKYKPFFDCKLTAFLRALKNKTLNSMPQCRLNAFLHNIYYKYISIRYKKALKSLNLDGFIFEPERADARISLKNDKNIYNFIFLDAFTPAKCPALWSLEFFKLLYEHLDENGMILTYSNSAAVRNAMINAGFFAGKIYNPEINKYTGTIAVKNKSLIKHELSEYDLGLINSKAGIFYRDENLDLSNEAIIAAHKIEVETSNKISSSTFIKAFSRNSSL